MTGEGAHARALEAHTRRLLAENAGLDEGEPLRRALHAEAAGVVPAGGLEAIRARVAARRPWWRRVLGRWSR